MKELRFDEEGLIPAVVQDRLTGEVRMVAFMNQEAVTRTLASGKATFFSRSRRTLWEKGESSGNTLFVREVYLDCDADTVLLKVRQVGGAACHEGYKSCFFRRVRDGKLEVVGERVFDPAKVYKR
jgi:phosphoribosyl-AMP cyclohydrolase